MEVARSGILAPGRTISNNVVVVDWCNNTSNEDQNTVINKKVANHTKTVMNRLINCLTCHSQVVMWLLV